MSLSRSLTVTLAGAALAACGVIHGSSVAGPDRQMPPTMLPHAASRDTLAARRTTKRVTDKEAPYTLVAQDASRCVVSDTQFSSVHVGDSVPCDWYAPADKPPPAR